MTAPARPSPLRRDPARRLVAEAIGTAGLLVAVVGSGIATSTGGAASTQLFQHAAIVGVVLTVLIATLGPISDAHFNPAVTLAAVLVGRLPGRLAGGYVAAQLTGAVAGTVTANLLFARPGLALGDIPRSGVHLWGSEGLATAGLIVVIFGLLRTGRSSTVPAAVGAWVGAAIFFTSSMCFANPAVSIARMFTDSWTGIVPAHAPAYVAAQLLGTAVAVPAVTWLFKPGPDPAEASPPPGRVAVLSQETPP